MKLNNIKWNKDSYNEFINYLYSYQDIKYRKFHKKLILDDKLIGIRIPILKKISKDRAIITITHLKNGDAQIAMIYV